MLEFACNVIVWIVGGPYMGVVAVGCTNSHKFGLITKQNVFHRDGVTQSDRNLFRLHDPWGGDLAHFGSGMSSDLSYVKFAISAFEMCAFDGQFGE
jgi:hypothetical protein